MLTQEAEAGGPQVPHKHALHSKILSQKAKQSDKDFQLILRLLAG